MTDLSVLLGRTESINKEEEEKDIWEAICRGNPAAPGDTAPTGALPLGRFCVNTVTKIILNQKEAEFHKDKKGSCPCNHVW